MGDFTAGANLGLASLITVAVVGMAALYLNPLLHHLPQAVLAAVIILPVLGLMDFDEPRRLWRYSRADAAALIFTLSGSARMTQGGKSPRGIHPLPSQRVFA